MRGSRLVPGALAALVLVALVVTSAGSVSAAPGLRPISGQVTRVYDAAFNETGLPAGTYWHLRVASIGCGCSAIRDTIVSTDSSIVASLPNGSYRYHVLEIPGYVVVGVPRGTFTVAGASPPTVDITFVPLVTYAVTFTETGLFALTSWSVTVAGNGVGQIWTYEHRTNTSATATIGFSLPNATYHYTVAPVNGSFFDGPSHGTFVVVGGAPAPIAVAFVTPAIFAVSFLESGLLPGLSWSVHVHGVTGPPVSVTVTETRSAAGTTVSFYLPNGSYTYRVNEVLGFVVVGSASGTVTVAGTPLSVGVAYQQVGSASLYLVGFNESGLASGTSWTVRVTATHDFGRGSRETGTSTSSAITFALQNATFKFSVHAIRGYTLNLSSGRFTVDGAALPTIYLTYTPDPTYAVTFNETGLPNGTNWSVHVYTTAGAFSEYPVRVTETGNTSEIVFLVPNGTFCYRILAVHGWRLPKGTATGSFEVDGAAPAEIAVTFSPTK